MPVLHRHILHGVLERGLARGAEVGLAAWLLRRLCGSPLTLENRQQMLGLTMLVAIGSNAATAVLGAAVVTLGFGAPFWPSWLVWWLTDGVSILLLTSLILTWSAGLEELRVYTRH
jgi:integral membrane sensor domain MASE1